MKWLVIDKDEIIGWHESGKATAVPPDEGDRHYEDATNNTLYADYVAARATLKADGRTDRPKWNGSAVVIDADTRPLIHVSVTDRSVDPTENAILMDEADTDSVNLRVESTSHPNYSGSTLLEIKTDSGERKVRLNFSNGIATRTLNIKTPGEYLFTSSARYKVANPLRIIVFA